MWSETLFHHEGMAAGREQFLHMSVDDTTWVTGNYTDLGRLYHLLQLVLHLVCLVFVHSFVQVTPTHHQVT